ncbi:hypothetical protein Pla144_06590 [Bythopirellula polymerisocia]|uniref:Uncharacterized protein n=1 Tax=Bythopirellula polymerisocia TaxID=2528003 RepID=A0A5C6D4T3_9BACT|nr:hypothetical protein Pla144_06590 [Bythopirellula polymerisocia]
MGLRRPAIDDRRFVAGYTESRRIVHNFGEIPWPVSSSAMVSRDTKPTSRTNFLFVIATQGISKVRGTHYGATLGYGVKPRWGIGDHRL